MLKRLMVVILVAIPAFAQMRTAKTVFDVPKVKDKLENAAMNADVTMTVEPADAQTLSDDDQRAASACTGATIKIGLLPVGNSSAAAQCFWAQEGSEVLKHAEMLNLGGSTAVATEVLSDFVGGVRIAFTTAVASGNSDDDDTTTNEDEAETATNLLRANGGNVALAASYPLYANPYPSGEFVAITYGRLGGVFAAFGDTGTATANLDWSKLNANAELAVTTETTLRTDAGTFNFEVYTNAGIIAGTKLFQTSIGADSGAFLHGEIGASVKMGTMFTVGASWNWYSADGVPDGATVVVGFGR